MDNGPSDAKAAQECRYPSTGPLDRNQSLSQQQPHKAHCPPEALRRTQDPLTPNFPESTRTPFPRTSATATQEEGAWGGGSGLCVHQSQSHVAFQNLALWGIMGNYGEHNNIHEHLFS